MAKLPWQIRKQVAEDARRDADQAKSRCAEYQQERAQHIAYGGEISGISNAIKALENKYRSNSNKQEGRERVKLFLECGTAILLMLTAIFTGFALYYSKRSADEAHRQADAAWKNVSDSESSSAQQARDTQEQLSLTKQSADAATQSADATNRVAKSQTETAEATKQASNATLHSAQATSKTAQATREANELTKSLQRAWIGAGNAYFTEPPILDGPIKISVNIVNSGKEPAKVADQLTAISFTSEEWNNGSAAESLSKGVGAHGKLTISAH